MGSRAPLWFEGRSAVQSIATDPLMQMEKGVGITLRKVRAWRSIWLSPPGLQGSQMSVIMMVTRRWFGFGLHSPTCKWVCIMARDLIKAKNPSWVELQGPGVKSSSEFVGQGTGCMQSVIVIALLTDQA